MEAPSQRALDSAANGKDWQARSTLPTTPRARSAALTGTFEPARSAQVSDGLHR
jgi:hypothetical protein